MERFGASAGALRLALGEEPAVVVLELGRRATGDLGLAMLAVGGLAQEGTKELWLTIVDPLAARCVGLVVGHTSPRGMRVSVKAFDERWIHANQVSEWARSGLSQLTLTLAAPEATVSDHRRQQPGCFGKVVELAQAAAREGLSVRIETPWCSQAESEIVALLRLVETLGAVAWTVVLPVKVEGAGLSPEGLESLLGDLANSAVTSQVRIDTRNAPQFQRVMRARLPNSGSCPMGGALNDGRGMLCIDDEGNILPSDALRLACGSLRRDDPLEVYRFHPTFRTLRDTELFDEPCHVCDYRSLCGGSRARAYAHTGKLLAADPLCAHPAGGA